MFKSFLAASLLLAASACPAQEAGRHSQLAATGDGEARLSVDNEFSRTTLRVSAGFIYSQRVKDSTEAQSKSRWFIGELRVNGKVCSDAKARITAVDGSATGRASTSCSVDLSDAAKHGISVEAIVTKTQGVEHDDVRVEVYAEKS